MSAGGRAGWRVGGRAEQACDGYILPTLLEIIGGVSLSCVKINPQTKEERVRNILHCLKFLCRRGVDISGLEPAEIEGGHLKIILHLVGNIRNHFKDTYRPEINGSANHVVGTPAVGSQSIGSPLEHSNWSCDMPGAIRLPGAVPTPFLQQKRETPNRHGPPDLPGLMTGESDQETKINKPHSNIISTTEIGVNGVAQHGVDERRNHFGMNNNNNTGSVNGGFGAKKSVVIRHPNARPLTDTGTEGHGAPPNSTQRAWTDSPSRLQSSQGNNGVSSTSPSVEDRLRQLISSKQSLASTGSSNGPVGRLNNQPSRPGEKREGSRADIIRSRPPSAIAFRQPHNNPQVAGAIVRARPSSAAGNMTGSSSYGRDNAGYIPDNGSASTGPAVNGWSKPGGNNESPVKESSNDLRNAWNRLYGSTSQAPPYVSPSMQRASRQQQPLVGTSQQYNQSSSLPPQPSTSRPVSAPSPSHMAAHFHDKGQGHSYLQQGQGNPHTSNHRESPMGQSSSTQGQLDESTSSHQSKTSQDNFNAKSLHVNTNPQYLDNAKTTKLSDSSPSSLSQPSPNSPGSPNYAIGPSSKYPDNPSGRPTSARKPPTLPGRSPIRLDKPGYPQRNVNNIDIAVNNERKQHNVSFPDTSDGVGITPVTRRKHSLSQDLTTALQAASREQSYKLNLSHDISYDQSHHDLSQDFQNQSIFDYSAHPGSESTGSVTPPLPPLSPTNTPPETPRSDDEARNLARSISATNVSFAVRNAGENLPRESRKHRRTSELNLRMDRKSHEHGRKTRSGYKSKGAILRNVNESETETESNQSFDFDIDNTILTIESHDTEQPHPAGDLMTSRENLELRHHMHNLESRYHDIQSHVNIAGGHSSRGHNKGPNVAPPAIGRPRRWSIGSSDTSSFRREAKVKPGKQAHHKHHSREFKNINKRFQRLESHVVTLARSVAHLSSELRTHNTMVNDLESVKRQLAELRDNPSGPFPNMLSGVLTEQQIFREWAPGLTNPKRVNKLTKFFGSEPPLLELFLQKLGYERYVPNFQTEHIGMIELPYMTEDRLEKIGIPMGPRLRILQEAKQCFRHDNVDVYVV
ncbi:hypothetical protein DPMN_089273 [Dreissena polymorpha]|uniref:Calponin-homology (CH) domain-containing protein n=2 Tax=Dreissena polymorpha TaxID=45954 RepID=A0A9D4KWL9_DREPO|nr:hypothetical protein DPMN_089273 [Dreissena polymorpha]